MRWTPFPEYRPSGTRWLGDIPAGWRVRKLKHVAAVSFSSVDKHTLEGEGPVRLCNYVDVYYNDHITPDLEFMEATAAAEEKAKFALREGDVLVTKDSEEWDDIAVSARAGAGLDGVLCGYHLALIRPRPAVLDGAYLFRAFSARGINDQFRVEATGVTRYGLSKYGLDNGLFPVPPVDVQRAIAAFLDRETERIDGLIAKKERQIELLEEKRAALISHAVTKGLDPAVKMKDSGIAWLGRIPAHWEILHLRRVVRKFVDYRGQTPEKVDSGIPLITARNIKGGKIDFSLSEEYMREEDYHDWMVRGWPERGDVLVTTEAPLCEVAQIADTRIALAQRIIMLKVNRALMLNGYLKYHFMSTFGRGEMWSNASGSTAIGIKAERFKGTLILKPPLKEQGNIVALLEQGASAIEEPCQKIRQSIVALREYRTALISAAVTGKIDVREEVA